MPEQLKKTRIEATFSWNDKLGDEFNYKAGVNFAVNNNAIKQIYSSYFDKLTGGDLGNGHYTKEIHIGDPIGSFYVYEHTGYTEDGAFAYSSERINAGSYIPKLTYGFNLGFDYKNFDFSTDWYGVMGNKVYNGKKAQRWGGENVEMNEFNDFGFLQIQNRMLQNLNHILILRWLLLILLKREIIRELTTSR